MDKGSAGNNQGNHHSHGADDFISQVRTLREAEKSASQRIEEAKKQASQIEAAAREQAVEIAAKAQQKAVEAKNIIITKEREATDSEIHSILGAARKQAGAIKGKRLPDSEVAKLSGL